MNTVTLVNTVVKTTLIAYATLVTNENIVTRKRLVMLVIIATMYNSVYSNHAIVGNLGEKNNNGNIIKHSSHLWTKSTTKVWFGLYVHPFSHTCNIGLANYRLQFIYYNTTYMYIHTIYYNK